MIRSIRKVESHSDLDDATLQRWVSLTALTVAAAQGLTKQAILARAFGGLMPTKSEGDWPLIVVDLQFQDCAATSSTTADPVQRSRSVNLRKEKDKVVYSHSRDVSETDGLRTGLGRQASQGLAAIEPRAVVSTMTAMSLLKRWLSGCPRAAVNTRP